MNKDKIRVLSVSEMPNIMHHDASPPGELDKLREKALSDFDRQRFSHMPSSEHQKVIDMLSKIINQNSYIIALLEEDNKCQN